MPSTPANGFPYPPLTGVQPNVPQHLQELAQAIEAKMPRGRLAYAARTSQAGPVNSGGGFVTVSGLSQSVTLLSARALKLSFQGQSTSNQAGTVVGVRLWNATTSGGTTTTVTINTANYGHSHANMVVTYLPAGTYTFHVQLAHFGGSGGAYLTADPAQFLIEDIGPA